LKILLALCKNAQEKALKKKEPLLFLMYQHVEKIKNNYIHLPIKINQHNKSIMKHE